MESEIHNQVDSFLELMTEAELVEYLRIPEVANGQDPANVIKNLKRMRGLPCIHIARQPLYPRVAIRQWIADQVEKEVLR